MGIMKRGFRFPPMGSLEGKCFVNLYKQLLFLFPMICNSSVSREESSDSESLFQMSAC